MHNIAIFFFLIIKSKPPETMSKIQNQIIDEPLLQPDPREYSLFPLKYPKIFKQYKDLLSTFWTIDEVSLEQDKVDFLTLSQEEKHYLCTTLAFFASADCIVNLNLLNNFCNEIQPPEASCFLAFQAAQENIHAEVYNVMIEELCEKDEHHTFKGKMVGNVFEVKSTINSDSAAVTFKTANKEHGKVTKVETGFELAPAPEQSTTELYVMVSRKEHLFNSLTTMPAIRQKANWALKWADPESNTFQDRLVAWAIVEGLLFASSFAAIAFFKSKGVLAGVGTVNEWISRDESAHCDFACLLLREYIKNRPSKERVYEIFKEAIEIEDVFVESSLPVALIGINASDMKQYIRYCANRLLKSMDYEVPTTAPFDPQAKTPWNFINLLSVPGVTNFFEKKVADYSKSTMNKGQIAFNSEF